MKEITNEIKEVQKIALNVLIYIDKVCRDNKIRYSLAGGSLLGAIRHKGFIPWDDDIDIFMPRDDYEKFLKIMDEDAKTNEKIKCLHFDEKYPDYFYRFAKVCDTSTTLQESTFIRNENLGVFVDIFPIDGIDIKKAHKIIKKSSYYNRMVAHSAMIKLNKKNVSTLKYLIKKYIICPFSKISGYKYWWNKSENFIKQYKFDNWDYVIPYSGVYKEKDIFPKKFFDTLVEYDFEGCKFLAIKDYDPYLKSIYGDYMTPPPPEKRITHHDFKIYKK